MTTTIYNCNSVLNFGYELSTTYIEVYNLAPKLKKINADYYFNSYWDANQ